MSVWALIFLILSAVSGLPQYSRWAVAARKGWLYTGGWLQLAFLAASAVLAAIVQAQGLAVPHPTLVIVFSVAAAMLGGGPVTKMVLSLSEHSSSDGAPTTEAPDDTPVLRGGTWIGLLERLAIAATLWAGWPEGLAVVLAVKGLGRYSELSKDGAAERFILGTFASVIWACAAVGIGYLLI